MSTTIIYLAMIDSPEGRHKFRSIYNRYKNPMFYTASKILDNTRDSEDIVHDVFLKIIEIIDDITDVEYSQIESLVVTIAKNEAINLYRKRRKRKITPFKKEYLEVPDRSKLDSIEDSETLARMVASLPGKYWEVPFLKYSHGCSVDEIALILPMSKENVKKTIQRARKKLEQLLESEEV